MKEIKDETFFVFEKTANLPIYIRTSGEMATMVEPFLKEMRFEKLPVADNAKLKKDIESKPNARVLLVEEASINVVAQISGHRESDLFGPESISPFSGHKIYRYRGVALMLYSFRMTEWEVGFVHEFLTDNTKRDEAKLVIHRYLGWALSLFGVVGFWGNIKDDHAVIFKTKDNKSTLFYIDILNQRLLSPSGISKIKGRLCVVRPSQTVRGRTITMTKEELLSFLHLNTTFFDYSGPSVPVRQVIQKISLIALGVISPSVDQGQNLSL